MIKVFGNKAHRVVFEEHPLFDGEIRIRVEFPNGYEAILTQGSTPEFWCVAPMRNGLLAEDCGIGVVDDLNEDQLYEVIGRIADLEPQQFQVIWENAYERT